MEQEPLIMVPFQRIVSFSSVSDSYKLESESESENAEFDQELDQEETTTTLILVSRKLPGNSREMTKTISSFPRNQNRSGKLIWISLKMLSWKSILKSKAHIYF